jgi:hypothetical protein
VLRVCFEPPPKDPAISDLAPDTLLPAALAFAQGAAVMGYVACQAGLTLYASHRYSMLGGSAAAAPQPQGPSLGAATVTIQLPVYNEALVVERLIDAACAIRHPFGRLQVQVLDDSTDETSAIAAAAVARQRAAGVDVQHVRRGSREGFKAGALAAGMASARGEFIAVFDADFVPAPDFLERLLPYMNDPAVGLVQARWTHLNRERSWLTRAQAVLLDAHFLLEHTSRERRGQFFNFNGTAGLWRRACIEEAGGWSHDTLTEDLDLSFRAQLAGWRFRFAPHVTVPAELPADMEAFKSQQRRWAKGAIQTARKVLPRVFASPLPLRVKVEAFFHLTSNAAYPLLVALGLLLLPVMLGTSTLPAAAVLAIQAGVLALGVVPVAWFLFSGQRAAGAQPLPAFADTCAALVLGMGLAINNTRAVLEALGSRVGDWERTPKTGERAHAPVHRAYASAARLTGRTELAFALYFAAVLAWAAASGQARAVPFLALLVLAHAWVATGSLRASRAAVR